MTTITLNEIGSETIVAALLVLRKALGTNLRHYSALTRAQAAELGSLIGTVTVEPAEIDDLIARLKSV